MTIDDVNKITGISANGTTLEPEVEEYFEKAAILGYKPYGSDIEGATGWTPNDWINASEDEKISGTGISVMKGKSTAYGYQANESTLKTANTNSIRYKLLWGMEEQVPYWLASTGVTGYGEGCAYRTWVKRI